MTVAQLIERLKTFPPTLVITHVDGENGRIVVRKVEVVADYHISEVELVEIS
jgi:hypothetical protein